jgi:hypothetical protein
MKKIYSTLFAAFCASLCATAINAQTVLYTNNFDNASSFSLATGSSNTWVINNVYQGGALFSGTLIPTVPSQPASFSNPNQNYLHPTSPLAFGQNLQTITNANYVIGAGSGNLRAVMNTSIDASEYTDITISFWRVGGLNGMKVIFSTDGGQTWQDAGLNFQGSPTTWTQETITVSALSGQSNIRVGFEMMEGQLSDPAPNPYHSIDELSITGVPDVPTPSGEISINLSVPISGYCSGQSVSATYNVVTGNINSGNIYSLELSDATGNFDNAVVIGTSSSVNTTGTVNGVLPNDLTGSNFRMRITSSNEAIIGNDNGTNFTIAASPATPVITLNSATGQLEVTTNATSFQWYFFGEPIPNSQNQTSITPLMNGGYTVIATNGNCERSSEIFTVNFVGIDEEILSMIRVYPNPFSSLLHLEYDGELNSGISVLDVSGKVVFQSKEMLQTINLEKLNSGMYFIQFHGLNGQTIRVIKE